MHTITAKSNNATTVFTYDSTLKQTLKDILFKEGIIINTPCGGTKICKKCSVEIITPENESDFVLSCSYIPDSDITVILPDSAITDESIANITDSIIPKEYSIAVDLGSTSITMIMVPGGQQITFANPTSAYGQDILSRISASDEGMSCTIKELFEQRIKEKAELLINKSKADISGLKNIIISGNYAMLHLLLGYKSNNAFVYPFKSSHLVWENMNVNGVNINIIPSFSSFIGGDIVSGLYYLNILNEEKRCLFIDLGTNAEIVLWDRDKLLCTSAAAGPAFEACGLTYGSGYISGAIYHAEFKNNTLVYKTVDNALAKSICGSGALYIISQLLSKGIIDRHGTLLDDYIENGYPIARIPFGTLVITQNDIRMIQLAISAIKTAINILLSKCDLAPSDIDKVYICGAFGAGLNLPEISNLHIIPDELNTGDKVFTLGNTSLKGAVKFCNADDHDKTEIDNIINKMTELPLATHPDFNELFLSGIDFYE